MTKATPKTRHPKKPKSGLNPQSLRRLELVNLIAGTGLCTMSNATLGNWIASGCPRNPDNTFSLVRVAAWLAAERRKKPVSPASGTAIEELRVVQKKLAEFELARRQGLYFDRVEVVALFEEAGARMGAVIEAVERNHGPSVGATLREALSNSFANVKETLAHGDHSDKSS